jgi:hypothetical protein
VGVGVLSRADRGLTVLESDDATSWSSVQRGPASVAVTASGSQSGSHYVVAAQAASGQVTVLAFDGSAWSSGPALASDLDARIAGSGRRQRPDPAARPVASGWRDRRHGSTFSVGRANPTLGKMASRLRCRLGIARRARGLGPRAEFASERVDLPGTPAHIARLPTGLSAGRP